eukprot:SAG11_NODE_4551_length_1853_cov_4.169897_1_plen_69_part_00
MLFLALNVWQKTHVKVVPGTIVFRTVVPRQPAACTRIGRFFFLELGEALKNQNTVAHQPTHVPAGHGT